MTTELSKFKEAYATMTVATYEPLILRWISGWTLRTVAGTIAKRKAKADMFRRQAEGAASTAIAIASVHAAIRIKSLPSAAAMADLVKGRNLINHDDAERAETAGVQSLNSRGFRKQLPIAA